MTVKREVIVAWLDERGWPHDPHDQTTEQNKELRAALGICGARTRSHYPCGHETHPKRCKHHGGASLKGIAHPNYQGKGYSRYVPDLHEAAVSNFLEHGDHLGLVEAIGTWEGRIDELLRSLPEGDAGELWRTLAKELDGLWNAIDAGEIQQALIHRRRVEEIVDSGNVRLETWRQIREAEETRTRLIKTEDRKRERLRGYITAEQERFKNQALRMAVIEGVELIEDTELQRKVRSKIAERFIQILGPAALPGPATD